MPHNDWMAGFTNRGDLTLTDITFPGSHDAGLSDANYVAMSVKVGKKDTICHDHDIAGQLAAGSRAFDVRLKLNNNVATTYHSEGLAAPLGIGGWGQTLPSIIQQIDTFLGAHAGEIVIVRISHTDAQAGAAAAALVTASAHAYKAGPRNIAAQPLSALRGKAIWIFDEEALPNVDPANGTHRFYKYPGKVQGGLGVCGKFSGFSANMKNVGKDSIERGNEHGTHKLLGKKHDHIFMIYWQLSFDVKNKATNGANARVRSMNHLEDGKGTHFNLDYILNVHRAETATGVDGKNPKLKNDTKALFQPNWINLDFVNDAVCQKVIEFNTDMLALRH